MQAIRVLFILGLIIAQGSCGSSNEASGVKDSEELFDIEAWYILEVGGRPETGRSHYYRMKINKSTDCRPDSIYFDDEAFAFARTDENGVWEAYRHFEPDDKVPGGLLSAVISINCRGQSQELALDSIYLRESVILP